MWMRRVLKGAKRTHGDSFFTQSSSLQSAVGVDPEQHRTRGRVMQLQGCCVRAEEEKRRCSSTRVDLETRSGRSSCWVTWTSTFSPSSVFVCVLYIFRSVTMATGGANLALGLVLCALLAPSQPGAPALHCHQVRSSFQLLYPGMKWAPETPVSGKLSSTCPSFSPHLLRPRAHMDMT